jgi:hypothetical protein
MTNIGSNTLNIARPTKASAEACRTGCGDGTGNCSGDLIRRKRDKVKEKIGDYVLLMLGAPRVKVELDEQNLDMAVDQALQIFEDYAPREFFQYLIIRATPGKSVYEMPPEVGVIRAVSYKETANFAFQASDLDGAIPIEYFYPGGAYSSIQGGLIDPIQPIWGRMGEWTLYKQYEHMYSRISSNIGGWEWVGDTNTIKVYPTPFKPQAIIVHYLQQCKDWRQTHQVMQEGALAHAMIMLGNVRGKYTGPLGPSQVTLDGEYMRTKGWELKDKWQEELLTRYGDILPITMG